MLVDSHCHINFDGLGERLPEVMENARLNNVSHMVAISVDMANYPRVREIADSYENVYCSVGVHPNTEPDGSEGFEPSTEQLVEMAGHERVVGIGETGLDYFRSEGDLEWQRDRFRRHIDAGRQTELPLIGPAKTLFASATSFYTCKLPRSSHCQQTASLGATAYGLSLLKSGSNFALARRFPSMRQRRITK
jgi:Tat protein secretion system quality control protein TatD with DNase activity